MHLEEINLKIYARFPTNYFKIWNPTISEPIFDFPHFSERYNFTIIKNAKTLH